jgi:hypothetical protein
VLGKAGKTSILIEMVQMALGKEKKFVILLKIAKFL